MEYGKAYRVFCNQIAPYAQVYAVVLFRYREYATVIFNAGQFKFILLLFPFLVCDVDLGLIFSSGVRREGKAPFTLKKLQGF